MKLTWKEFFPLVGEMLELKQKEIAAHLDVNSSTISRLAAGKVKRPTCMKRENLYKNLFDTTNDKSPVYNKNEKDLLETFIAIIREKNYEEAIKDLRTDSYEPFILGMLRLIRENQPPRVKSSGEKEDSLFRDIRVKDTAQSVVVSDQTHETFEQTNCDPSTPQNDSDYNKFSVDVPRIKSGVQKIVIIHQRKI